MWWKMIKSYSCLAIQKSNVACRSEIKTNLFSV